jgi:hypothetical protein
MAIPAKEIVASSLYFKSNALSERVALKSRNKCKLPTGLEGL